MLVDRPLELTLGPRMAFEVQAVRVNRGVTLVGGLHVADLRRRPARGGPSSPSRSVRGR